VMVRKQWRTIVGVVRDSKYFSFTEVSRPHYYLPFRQGYLQGLHILFFVRAKGDPEAVIPTLRAGAAAIDPTAGGFTAAALAEHNALLLIPIKLTTSLLAMLALIAIVLAGVGLYGVVSYGVNQRRRELAIRRALGAKPHELLRMVAREGILLTTAGVVCGLMLALVSMRALSSLLVGIRPFDVVTFVGASLFLIAISAIATVVPALRATRIEPIHALRGE
jgi:putative ABC transport system permease protein